MAESFRNRRHVAQGDRTHHVESLGHISLPMLVVPLWSIVRVSSATAVSPARQKSQVLSIRRFGLWGQMMIDAAYCYEVRKIQDGHLVYRGRNLAGAARKLATGTCCGVGTTPMDATQKCRAKVSRFSGWFPLKGIGLDTGKIVG